MANKKTPREAASLFESIMKASVKNTIKPKTMNKEEAQKKRDNYQSMIGHKYNFPSGIAKAIKVSEFEVKQGVFEVLIVGEADNGYYFAFIADNNLKPVNED